MIVRHKSLLKEFQDTGRCEHCGKRGPVDAAHIYSVGAGRVDIRQNIVALCRVCHTRQHTSNRNPSKGRLLIIAARREGCRPREIQEKVYRLRACDLCKVWEI